MRTALSLLVCVFGWCGAAYAADAPKLKIMYPAWNDPRIVAFYDAKCDEESAEECVVFDIGCDENKSMRLTVMDVKEPTLAFARSGKASMELYGDMLYRLRADRAELSEIGGAWDLTLRVEDIAIEDFSNATSMAVNYGHKFKVPLDEPARAAFASAAKACGYTPKS
jgi:hypothetical protein